LTYCRPSLVSRRKFGSKAAYVEHREAMKMPEDTDYAKQRSRDQLEGDGQMQTHMLLMAAALAGGMSVVKADGAAEQAIDVLKRRFT